MSEGFYLRLGILGVRVQGAISTDRKSYLAGYPVYLLQQDVLQRAPATCNYL